jgi:TRAP-type C4-dicarboxylate transport system permease small subunit
MWLTKVSQNLDKVCEIIERISIYICIVCGVVLFASTFAGVVFRYVIRAPLKWSEELARILFVWIVFFGGNIVTRQERHLSLDFLENLFPATVKHLLYVLSSILGLVFLSVVLYVSILMTDQIGRISNLAVIPISMSYPYMALPIGSMLMIVQIINNLMRYFVLQKYPGSNGKQEAMDHGRQTREY